MTPIERASRALCANQRILFLRDTANPSPPRQTVVTLPDEWDEIGEASRAEFRKQARAVIAAIREPSEGMHEAGDAVVENNALGGWYAMIDALLAEGE